jgi:hypothetical protein
MLWHGAVMAERFLSGASMIIAGDLNTKVVLYPIARDAADAGRLLTNWVVWAKLGDGSPSKETWSKHSAATRRTASRRRAQSCSATGKWAPSR